MNYLNLVGPQIRKLRYQQGYSQAGLVVKIQLKGWDVSRQSLAKIECQVHRVTDKELLYFADVLKVPLADLYPPVNSNGHFRESVENLSNPKKNPRQTSCSDS